MADLLTPEERAALQEAPPGAAAAGGRVVSPALFPSAGQLDPERTAVLATALFRWMEPLALELSRHLRLPCTAQAPCQESAARLAPVGEPEEEYGAVVEGIPGSSLRLSMPRAFVAAICERIFGAPFEVRGDRPLSPAEQALARDLVGRWLGLFSHGWPDRALAPQPEPDTGEEMGEPAAAGWLEFTTRLVCGPVEGCIRVALAPLTTRVLLGEAVAGAASALSPDGVVEKVGDVPVVLRAVLGQADFSLDELSSLRIGDVIALDRRAQDPVDIVAEDRTLFRARAGLAGQWVAVELIGGAGDRDEG